MSIYILLQILQRRCADVAKEASASAEDPVDVTLEKL